MSKTPQINVKIPQPLLDMIKDHPDFEPVEAGVRSGYSKFIIDSILLRFGFNPNDIDVSKIEWKETNV